MPDVLGNQQSTDQSESGLGSSQGKSPLEEDNLKSPPSPLPPTSVPEPAVTPPPPADQPPAPEPPSGGQAGPNGTVPDTEEFLKSILEETPPQPASASADLSATPAAPETPTVETPAPPLPPPAPPTLPEAEAETPAPAPASEPKIKDSVSGWDDIMAPADSAQVPPPGQAVGQELGAAPAQPQGGKGSLRLIILVLVIVAIAVGGYFAYTTFFSTPTEETTDQSSQITQSPVAIQTSDEIRKSDLASLQTALKNYFAGSGSYPVAEKLILLGSEDNVLSAALVPAYLDKIPLDPDYPSKQYGYISDGKTFTLSAIMDSSDDPTVVTEGGLYLYKVTPTTLVSSPEDTTGSPIATEPEVESEGSPLTSEGLNL